MESFITTQDHQVDDTFNDDGLSDIVIRTSTMDFNVHKWPLRHRSTVFKDMLSFPQPTGVGTGDIVQLVESSKTIHHLLSVIYELHQGEEQPIHITHIDELSDFTHAAVKYDIPAAIMTSKSLMRQFLAKRTSPLRIFALARKFDFDSVLERAYRICITLPLTNPLIFSDPALRADLTITDYQHLHYCKSQRAEAAGEIISKHYRFAALCDECKRYGCGWWDEYILMVMLRLRERPTSDVLFEKVIINTCLQNRCPNEADNLAASEAYFTIIRVEIDSLPYIFQVNQTKRSSGKSEPSNYPNFSAAVAAACDARDGNLEIEELEEVEVQELAAEEEEIDCDAVEAQLVIA